jgi:hypothetical protein
MNYAGQSNWGRLRRSVDQVAGTDVSWGQVLYRASVVVALVILALAVGNSLYNVSENRPLVPLIPLMVAGVVWAVGWGFRYLLTDR